MSTVVVFAGRDVKAVVGSGKGMRAVVTRTCYAQAPEGSIVNGQVADEETFTGFLREFWEENHLPKRDVVLALESSRLVRRVIQVPKMSHRRRMAYLPREFAAVKMKEPVYGYLVMEREGTKCRLDAVMAEREILEPHIRRFRELGIRLVSIVPLAATAVFAVSRLCCIRDKTCIVQMIEGATLLNIVYVDGAYFYSGAEHISGQGRLEVAIESAKSVSNLRQFLKTQQAEREVSCIYLGGGFSDEDFDACRESILEMDKDLKVEKLRVEEGGGIRFCPDGEFADFTAPVGGLMAPKGKCGLLWQYYRNSERIKKRREFLRYAAPSVAAKLLLGAIAALQMFVWLRRTDKIDTQFDYLEDPQVIAQEAEYDRIKNENGKLSLRLGIIRKIEENLAAYPVYTSAVKQVIDECASGVATADVASFDRMSGAVSIEMFSDNEQGAHQFVERLEKRTDVFRRVFYDGFRYDEESGGWKAFVTAYLLGAEGDGEGMP